MTEEDKKRAIGEAQKIGEIIDGFVDRMNENPAELRFLQEETFRQHPKYREFIDKGDFEGAKPYSTFGVGAEAIIRSIHAQSKEFFKEQRKGKRVYREDRH